MKKESKKRIDMYDIGEGLTLMNVIEKNDSGKMRHITTYIGIEGNFIFAYFIKIYPLPWTEATMTTRCF